MINADRSYEIEFRVAKRDLQGVFLHTRFNSGDLPHHLGRDVAPCRVRKVRLEQMEQFPFSATDVQVTKGRGGCATAPEKPADQVPLTSVEKHRLLRSEPVSNRVAQQFFVGGRQLVEAGRLSHRR